MLNLRFGIRNEMVSIELGFAKKNVNGWEMWGGGGGDERGGSRPVAAGRSTLIMPRSENDWEGNVPERPSLAPFRLVLPSPSPPSPPRVYFSSLPPPLLCLFPSVARAQSNAFDKPVSKKGH